MARTRRLHGQCPACGHFGSDCKCDADPRLDQIRYARASLVDARTWLKMASCPQTLRKVHSAIKSIDGALRHARRATSIPAERRRRATRKALGLT